ncbi:BGTF surface domain-containing protein [Haloplanus halophilus]|uniref:DUF7827 domain-containing protein n=1 Tax=Haloplanus halophilus TaxID=2949993 RepID=UPI00203E061F|nr:BGTF surface domain-containing protein [Haloplanus sp. GDY1]
MVTAQDADDLQFESAVTTEQRGDLARLSMQVGDRDRVTLMVRAPDGNYDARIRAVDANDDGHVTVTLDTFQAGWTADESAAYAVESGDRLTSVRRRTDRLAGPLPTGRYNLVAVAGGDSTSASLVVNPGRIGSATAATVPRDRLEPGAASAVPGTPRFETGRVATGDHAVVAVNASGLGGVLSSTQPPGENLVYPTDSTPGASTTHTVSVDADRTVTPDSITVEYGDTAPQSLERFDAERVRHLGVDRDGDGIVETDLRPAIAGVDATERSLTLRLDTEATMAANETLLLRYRATNPGEAGTYGVRATVGETVETDGRVVYGMAGRGTLGYGIDLGLAADGDRTVVDPLAAVEYHYDGDRLYALVNTTGLTAGERYTVGLIRWGASPLGTETRAAATSVTITERRATLVDPAPEDPFVVASGERTVRVETTLAPTTEVVVEVSGSAPNSFLFRQSTRVDADRRLSATFDLPAAETRQSITVRIVDDGRVVGQARGEVRANS